MLQIFALISGSELKPWEMKIPHWRTHSAWRLDLGLLFKTATLDFRHHDDSLA